MAKKKHAEHVNHERWLVSYADLLTLLFAFFVVLFASSASDKKKTKQLAMAMQSAFTEHGVFDSHSKTPPLEPGAGNTTGEPMPLMLPIQTRNGERMGDGSVASVTTEVQRAMQALPPNAPPRESITVRASQEGTVISLREAGFFDSGSADVREGARQLLARLAAGLPDREFRVEGHTDNLPIHNERFHSNWQLSTARATSVAEVLMTYSHVHPSRFSLAGYGPYRPVIANDSVAHRAQNRRVDIVLLTSHGGKTLPPEEEHAPADAGDAIHAANALTAAAGSPDIILRDAPPKNSHLPLAAQLAHERVPAN